MAVLLVFSAGETAVVTAIVVRPIACRVQMPVAYLFRQKRDAVWEGCLAKIAYDTPTVLIAPEWVVLCHDTFSLEGPPAHAHANDIAELVPLAEAIGAIAFRPLHRS